MSSQRQIQANRRNAQRSTGPKTPEGKARVRLNALQHGLLASDTVLPDEDAASFAELLAAFEAEQQPATVEETMLVHRALSAHWRLRRLNRVETGLFARGFRETCKAVLDDDEEPSDPAQKYDQDTEMLGLTFIRNTNSGDTLVKLARYEAVLDRKFLRSLDRLHSLQAARARQTPPPQPPSAAPSAPQPSPPSADNSNSANGIDRNHETKPISVEQGCGADDQPTTHSPQPAAHTPHPTPQPTAHNPQPTTHRPQALKS